MKGSERGAIRQALLAGLSYFAMVFTAGFVLGAVRTIALLPRLGETGAVAAELPFMIAISFFVCRFLVGRFDLPSRAGVRLAMAAAAFALLMAAEFVLSVFAFGRTPAEFAAALAAPAGLLGLAGQIAFGAMALFVRRSDGPSEPF